MLQPKRSRYRKHHKPVYRCVAKNTTQLRFGDYGIRALSSGRLSARHVEALRRVCTRICRRQGRIWLCVYPHWVVSRKSAESRMGKGKGAVDRWVAVVKPGTVLYEIGNVKPTLAENALISAAKKLPMKCSIIGRD